jgi:hypothetical protein
LKQQVPTFILQDNLYGVDLSPEAVENHARTEVSANAFPPAGKVNQGE